MSLKFTHCIILVLHALLLGDVCYHCENGAALDDVFAVFGGDNFGNSSSSLVGSKRSSDHTWIRPIAFWSLVVASVGFYLAAAISDPGFVIKDVHERRSYPNSFASAGLTGVGLASGLASGIAVVLAGGEDDMGCGLPASHLLADVEASEPLGEMPPQAPLEPQPPDIFPAAVEINLGSAREVELRTTPGGVSYIYEDELEVTPGDSLTSTAGLSTAHGDAVEESVAFRQQEASDPFRAEDGTPDRFCKVCNQDQPMRSKHCHDCGRCVRTHDHHCPWIGNCVGENNRMFFFWFVLFQALETSWVLWQGMTCRERPPGSDDPPIWFMLGMLLVFIFSFALLMLTCVHTWLAVVNITTWEYLRWSRIPYLRAVDPTLGSPFSSSLWRNLWSYCCTGSCVACRMLLKRSAACVRRCPVAARGCSVLGWFLGCTTRSEHGGARIGAAGEIIWHTGPPHIPCIVDNQCCSCYIISQSP